VKSLPVLRSRRSWYGPSAGLFALVLVVGCANDRLADTERTLAGWSSLCSSGEWASRLEASVRDRNTLWDAFSGSRWELEIWQHSLSIQMSRSHAPIGIHTFESRSVNVEESGRADIRVVGEGWRFVGPRDRTRWEDAGQPDLSYRSTGQVSEFSVENYDFGYVPGSPLGLPELSHLDSSNLELLLHHAWGDSSPIEAASARLESLGHLLGGAPVPDRDHRILWKAFSTTPRTVCVGPSRDRFGRPGLLLRVQRRDYASEVLLDPVQGRALEVRRVAVGSLPFADAAPGEIVLRAVYVVPTLDVDVSG
jgi:hypothetical protein